MPFPWDLTQGRGRPGLPCLQQMSSFSLLRTQRTLYLYLLCGIYHLFHTIGLLGMCMYFDKDRNANFKNKAKKKSVGTIYVPFIFGFPLLFRCF